MTTTYHQMRHQLKRGGLGAAALLLLCVSVPFNANAYERTLSGQPALSEQCYELAKSSDTAREKEIALCTSALQSEHLSDAARIGTLTNRALLLDRAGESKQAQNDCDRAVAMTPSIEAAIISCAAIYIRNEAPARAVQALLSIQKPSAKHSHLYFHNLGLAYHDLERYDEAYQSLTTALETRPGFAPSADLLKQYVPVTE